MGAYLDYGLGAREGGLWFGHGHMLGDGRLNVYAVRKRRSAAVELRQQLVDHPLRRLAAALVAALRGQRVQLVEEQDARRWGTKNRWRGEECLRQRKKTLSWYKFRIV